MADKDRTSELSMEEYFNEGLADQTEPNNPFEITEQETTRHRRKANRSSGEKRGSRLKKLLILLLIIAVLVLALVIFLLIRQRRNDGQRYAKKLAGKIGSSLQAAEKEAKVNLNSESAYPTLNHLFASYQAITESNRSCRIQGVKLPQWAIFCNTSADDLSNVTYYNYKVLEKNVFGTERKSYLDPNLIQPNSTTDAVEEAIGLIPYKIQYLQGKTELREYRYCYEDKESGDVAAYVITAVWDESGQLSTISDSRKNYIGTLLASPET